MLPVTRRKTFIVPRRRTDEVLVFAPFAVNDYRASWTDSRSRTSRRGAVEAHSAEANRSFSFALHGGAEPLLADCDEQAASGSTRERRDDPARSSVPDHELRCTLQGAEEGVFELTVVNGRGELIGTGGHRFTVTALGATRSRWQEPGATGLLLRASSGEALAAVDFAQGGRVVLQRDLEHPGRRDLLAAAAAALLLADLAPW